MTKGSTVWMHDGDEIKAPFHYKGCGLDHIWLMSGYDLVEVDGEQAVSVRDLDGLHEAIAMSLVTNRKIIRGKEVRFLRKQLDLTQSELARLLGCDGQQVARYEKGANRIPGPADRVLRMLVREHFESEVSVKELLQALDEMDAKISDRQLFDQFDGHWAARAA